MKKLLLLVLTAALCSGCASTYWVKEYDDNGKVTKEQEVSESALKTLMNEMKDKNLAWGTNGWCFLFETTFVSSETYVPTFIIKAFNANRWHVSFKGEANEAAVEAIKAATAPGLKVETTGGGEVKLNSD